jgi:hypothetical protein
MPNDGAHSLGNIPSGLDSQLSLLPTRISTVYPSQPIGKHISFVGTAVDGSVYHCKSDADERPIRATEWIAQSLARHLGIAVPEFRVMERNDETFFGSRQAVSTADFFELQDFLTRNQLNELGGTSDWLGRRLSGLYVLDLFLNNPDRGLNNFLLEKDGYTRKLCAIDFADARLEDISSDRFPIAGSNTIVKGRYLRSVHGFYLDAALEMIERIRAVPASEMNGILAGMPSDWMSDDQKSQFCEAWAGGLFEFRLSALRAGLEDGSRL